jgi:hypothetical protein
MRQRVDKLKLIAHFFGHIHGGWGSDDIHHNVAICDEMYRPLRNPTVVEIRKAPGS